MVTGDHALSITSARMCPPPSALSENRQAFKRIFLVPRMMRDVQDVDLSIEVFGQELSMPIFVSPAGKMEQREDSMLATLRVGE